METSSGLKPEPKNWAEQLAAAIDAERDRAGEFLAAQQERIERAEAVLDEALSQLSRLESLARETPDAARLQHGNLDWATEKHRILAALESDFNENDSDQRAERIRIEGMLQAADRIVAEKDREIQGWKRQLEESSHALKTEAAATDEIRQILDADIVVREERERLEQLQAEWQEKLRQAEIDLSVERATLARQRAELESQSRSANGGPSPPSTEQAAPPVRGRWLARLGLTEADRAHRRSL